MLRIFIFFLCVSLTPMGAIAKIDLYEGLIAPENAPDPIRSRNKVFLDVPQIWQGRQPWCVPTSAAMALEFYGQSVSAERLKTLAEGHKHPSQRNIHVTSWLDMEIALGQVGANWKMRHYPKTEAGFSKGLRDIKRSLRRGRPVLIDVDLLTGHTFVLVGFDETEQVVFIRDPLLQDGRIRALSYWTLRENWHNRRLARTRSAFFTAP